MLITDAPYYFHGVLRSNLGFPDPNLAGIFLVSLIPLLWLLDFQSKSWIVGLVFGLEAIGYYLLAKTFSRGAVVGVVAENFFFSVFLWRRCRSIARQRIWSRFFIRIGAIVTIVGLIGFAARLNPSYLVSDQSVVARFELWKSGMRMVAAAPVHGWGNHMSGLVFGDWFQDITDARSYRGLVNTYLDLVVDLGLPVFFGSLVLIFASILVSVFAMPRSQTGHLVNFSLASIVVGFCVSAFFSSVWEYALLFLIPGLAAVLLFARLVFFSNKGRLNILLLSSVPSGALCLAIWIMGTRIAARASSVNLDQGFVRISPIVQKPTIVVEPSVRLMGLSFGKACREFAKMENGKYNVVVTESAVADLRAQTCDTLILVGESAELLSVNPATRCVLVRPIGAPPMQFNRVLIKVVLNEMNFEGVNAAWIKWAHARNYVVAYEVTDSPTVTGNSLHYALLD